ncbi:hypothetical protein EXIGLDRAFT_723361 [Exidia glandulosa HHB12029]|uniref:Uncharacterized protein n=1 Tax=Exidia glandulosa HHB12029 TaxID=1314781 RepID=A0A165EV17_EXIGL|nr:hypothetical protein EXIGLDRAFT_723361 [Exidia glandulosa HHB12029]
MQSLLGAQRGYARITSGAAPETTGLSAALPSLVDVDDIELVIQSCESQGQEKHKDVASTV